MNKVSGERAAETVPDPAAAFNESVWRSATMASAVRMCDLAKAELVDGKGWGLVALGNAELALMTALDAVRVMMKVDGGVR